MIALRAFGSLLWFHFNGINCNETKSKILNYTISVFGFYNYVILNRIFMTDIFIVSKTKKVGVQITWLFLL